MSSLARSAAIHFLVFAVAFSLEIRVRASEKTTPAAHEETKPAHNEAKENKEIEKSDEESYESSPVQLAQSEAPLQEPAGCLRGDRVCAVRTEINEKFVWKFDASTVTLDRGSSVLRETPTLIRLISGTVWVEAQKGFTVRTEFGDVKIDGRGEVWVSREDGKIFVSATSNDVILKPRGSSEDILVKTGNENWLSKVALKTGEAESGLPTAIPLREHIERWARLYPGTVKEFRIAVRSFHGRWSRAAEEAAALHRLEFQRKVAAIEDEKARQAEAARRREAENKKLRDLFRKKVFDGI